MLGWWSDLPWYLRYGAALFFIAIFLLSMFTDLLGKRVAVGVGAVGFALLLFAGRSPSEKKGYHF